MADAATPPDRRRRRLALAALAAALGAIVIVLGCGSGHRGGGQRATVRRAVRRERSPRPPSATRPAGSPGPPRPVPILMYHVVNDPPPGSPYPALYVPRAEFADQMRALQAAGYTAVTLQAVWDSWHAHGPLPSKPLVVSFDDGYRSQLTNALPVLRALGWPGVLNLELKNIRPDYGLTAPQLRRLLAAGWELDSHTIDHPDLTAVDAATLRHEVADSRTELRRRFGVPANFFCYPAGRYDAAAVAAVRAAGYLAATTTQPGLAEPDAADRFTLRRIRVDGGTSGAALATQLGSLAAS